MYQYELAGCVSETAYQSNIPADCSMQTVEEHNNNMMLCWGLIYAIERGEKMNCDNCDENKVNHEARIRRIQFKVVPK